MARRIDDLQCKGYKIIQDTDGFCFGMDAVLLANYAAENIKKGTSVADFGSGTGIISILLAAKTEAFKIYGIEIQKEVADMSKESVSLNGLEDRVEIINVDIKNIKNTLKQDSLNYVVSNPPYMNSGLKNRDEAKLISRHEIKCNFKDIASAAAYSLKTAGKFYLIHRSERLAEILAELRSKNLEPKRIRFIYPYKDKESNLFLLEAIKGARCAMKVERPLIVYEDVNKYTKEIHEIYGV